MARIVVSVSYIDLAVVSYPEISFLKSSAYGNAMMLKTVFVQFVAIPLRRTMINSVHQLASIIMFLISSHHISICIPTLAQEITQPICIVYGASYPTPSTHAQKKLPSLAQFAACVVASSRTISFAKKHKVSIASAIRNVEPNAACNRAT